MQKGRRSAEGVRGAQGSSGLDGGRRQSDEQRAQAVDQAGFVEGVVRDEDYATGLGIQRALASGAKRSVLFGRNEGGGQRFHRTLDRYIARDATPAQTPSST